MLTGKAASNVFDGNQISLAAAKKIARGCRDWAASKGESASIYVLDNAGEFVHMERMDGQAYNNIRTALLKAQTSLKTRETTSAIGANLKNNPAMTPRQTTLLYLFSNAGGVPIVVDGQMDWRGGRRRRRQQIGGDEKCAVEGLKAAFVATLHCRCIPRLKRQTEFYLAALLLRPRPALTLWFADFLEVPGSSAVSAGDRVAAGVGLVSRLHWVTKLNSDPQAHFNSIV